MVKYFDCGSGGPGDSCMSGMIESARGCYVSSGEYEKLEAKIKRLRGALEFYADVKNWKSPSKGFDLQYDRAPSPIENDFGTIAKQAFMED